MNLVTTIDALRDEISRVLSEGKTIGFIPTMGALHAGHISLVERSLSDNDYCVVSIFVNPTQFNNKEDLEKYPRNLARDTAYLKEVGVNLVFAPTADEVYPEPDTRVLDFGTLDKVMEGLHRPGHFNGVAQVVSRLFELVTPTRAYFGEKDFQQLAIIRQMVKQLSLPVEIVGMPIKREESGLALSSRNELLSEVQKEIAINISKTLKRSQNWIDNHSVSSVKDMVVSGINSIKELEVEYFEIVDGDTLQSITSWNDSNYIVGCITVYCGDVRLIDNIQYKKK